MFLPQHRAGLQIAVQHVLRGSYDCVDADAISQDTEGWNNWAASANSQGGAWHCPVYFNQLKRSTFTGWRRSMRRWALRCVSKTRR